MMTFPRRIPEGAKSEAVLSRDVALFDVSHILPKHETKTWSARSVERIVRCFVHHSGADGAEGIRGFEASARYSATEILDEDGRVKKSAWPGTAYTYWLPDLPDLTPEGRLVIYRGNADHLRTYHTGGRANRWGVAACFQGNRTRKGPSKDQVTCFNALVPWLIGRHELALDDTPFCPHSASRAYGGTGKPTCPGPAIEKLCKELNESLG